MNDLALLLDLFGNSEETKLLIYTAIFVCCLQRYRTEGLNSGQKSAIIVTDALYSVTVKNRHMECKCFDRTPCSRCSKVSNGVHTTSHLQTKLKVEFANLIAKCNETN